MNLHNRSIVLTGAAGASAAVSRCNWLGRPHA